MSTRLHDAFGKTYCRAKFGSVAAGLQVRVIVGAGLPLELAGKRDNPPYAVRQKLAKHQ